MSRIVLMLLLRVACCHASCNSVSTGFTVTRVPDDKDDFISNLLPILTSSDGKFSLLLTGCSIVLMQNSSQLQEKVLWLVDYRECEGIQDEWNTLHLQHDGDLVIYGNTKSYGVVPRWRSGTGSKGVKIMQLSETGILQLLDRSSSIMWQSSDSPSMGHRELMVHHHLRQLQEKQFTSQHWYQNYSCIFDDTNSFSYLHVGYVYYFNITYRESFQAAIDSCLYTCSNDCSCSAVVYNVDTECCYEFHQYIPVQTLPFNPVQKGDTLSVYIKVERGNSSDAPPQFSLHFIAIAVFSMVFAAALVL
ncbi:hypothetical protein O6H91_03G061400 [Diphasiastrum complanatum]|nr:hypothetical protein O6H91_03G061400 [Diphasiastrum complanatum]